MSRERYRARSKKVQKLGRDGLVEQDRATGAEQRVSRRTADVSFGPERPVHKDAAQRGGRSAARSRQWAQKQARQEQIAAAENLERAEAHGTERPAAPSRGDNAPLTRAPPNGGDRNERRKRRHKPSIRQQLDAPRHLAFEQSNGDGLRFEPERDPSASPAPEETENAPSRRADDAPRSSEKSKRRPNDRRGHELDAANHRHGAPQRLAFERSDGGGLRFEPDDAAEPEAASQESDAVLPRGADGQHVSRHASGKATRQQGQRRAEVSGRLRFEPERPDAPAPDVRTAANKRQTTERTPEAGKRERPRLRFEAAPQKGDKPTDALTAPQQHTAQSAQQKDEPPAEHPIYTQPPHSGDTVIPRQRLRFEAAPRKIAPLPKLAGIVTARTAGTTAMMAAHDRLREAEDDNVAVSAAHEGEMIAERGAGNVLRWQRSRRQTAAPIRSTLQAKWQPARRGAVQRERPTFTSNPFSRWQQKRAIQRQYAEAKRAGTQTAATANQTVARAAETVRRKTGDFVRKHQRGFLIFGAIVLVIAMFSSLFTSCSTLLQSGAAALAATTYPSEDVDMLAAEAWYCEKETELQTYLDTYESTHSYDEYHYELDEIEHDPYVLISTLTALRGGAWTMDEVRDTLQMLFDRQYILTETVTSETRTRTVDGEEEEYTYYICTVTLENFDLSHIPVYIMGEDQLSMYAAYMGALGNRTDLFPNSGYINRYMVQGYTDYEIPASALEDEDFVAMLAEAEKYLGYPYVWGGSNPNTSFDCSGFVSWVINHSGWNVGRLGAQGLYNICTPTNNPRPGDLVFFTGTYPQFADTAYGFLSRGCPRNCGFCIVSGKEGARSVKNTDLAEFWRGQREIKLMDANLLACPDRDELLKQLAESRAYVDFTQGLDCRLLNDDAIDALNRIRLKEIHFAWDSIAESDAVLRGLRQYAARAKRKPHGTYATVYVLTNYASTHEEDLYRVEKLRAMGYDPYVMVYDRPSAPAITRQLQRWANNKRIFRTVEHFEDYIPGRIGGKAHEN